MAQQAGEYSAPYTDTPIVSQEQWARARRTAGDADGVRVFNPNNPLYDPGDCRVVANGTSKVTVLNGPGHVNGFTFVRGEPKILDVPTNASSSSPRIDAVILESNQAGKASTVRYLRGGTSRPTMLKQAGGYWQTPLAYITIAAGSAVAKAENVQDARELIANHPIYQDTGAAYPSPPAPGHLIVRPGGRLITEVDGEWTQLLPFKRPTWHDIDFPGENEIRNYNVGAGGGYFNAAYAKFAQDIVKFRGLVESVSGTAPANVVIGRLPNGYRPACSVVKTVESSTGSRRITVHGENDPTDAGKIRSVASLPSGGWISLDDLEIQAAP